MARVATDAREAVVASIADAVITVALRAPALVAWSRRGGGHRLTADVLERALVGVSLNIGARGKLRATPRSGAGDPISSPCGKLC